jgi:hypothetical protein
VNVDEALELVELAPERSRPTSWPEVAYTLAAEVRRLRIELDWRQGDTDTERARRGRDRVELERLREENSQLRAKSHGRELGDGMALGIAIGERDALAAEVRRLRAGLKELQHLHRRSDDDPAAPYCPECQAYDGIGQPCETLVVVDGLLGEDASGGPPRATDGGA